jgi:hypothetical protein
MELEDCAMGDPFDDWGSLIAHFLWESRTEFPKDLRGRIRSAPSLARATAPERPARELDYSRARTARDRGLAGART